MGTSRRASAVALGSLVVIAACTSDPDDKAAPVPAKADLGFDMRAQSFAFANFADGYAESVMKPSLMARMFGEKSVCVGGTLPCELTQTASAFADKANGAMRGGRCEGFAVLTSLFALGALKPDDFGSPRVRDMVLEGNVKLQRELAYWFTTQLVPEATETKKLAAKDAVAFMATFLKPGAPELYRIGIVRKTPAGIFGGHSLMPLGYVKGKEPGIYHVRVYDSNWPDEEHELTIDVLKNRWHYFSSKTTSTPTALYYGDASNNNPLYFAPVKSRIATLPCRFCGGAKGTELIASGATIAAKDAAGKVSGIVDGKIVEAPGIRVTPMFSSGATAEDSTPIQITADETTGPLTIDVTGRASSATAEGAISLPTTGDVAPDGAVSAFGAGYAVETRGLALREGTTDTLTVDGPKFDYKNTSGTPVILSAAVQRDDGSTLRVEVNAPAGAREVQAIVDKATGAITVSTPGTTGHAVSIGVTKVDAQGGVLTGTVTATGSEGGAVSVPTADWAPGKPLTATQDLGDGQPAKTLIDTCADGLRGDGETDVDCGGVCAAKCAFGKGCAADADCASKVCNTTANVCVVDRCANGVNDGDEVDVDCGGSCLPCATGKTCRVATNCASLACHATRNVCVASRCEDGAKNDLETDIDCGGDSCGKCGVGKGCAVAGDCASGICTGLTCAEKPDRIVFVSSVPYNGNLGGLAGADAKCQTLATAAGLYGTYKAFLSDGANTAASRLSRGTAKYVRTDDVVVANDAASFFSDSHLAAIERDESAAVLSNAEAWTGTVGAGTGTGGCANWTSAQAATTASCGISSRSDAGWARVYSQACDRAIRLYCVQQ